MSIHDIGNRIQQLPEHLVPEVLHYIEFLINKYGQKNRRKEEVKFKFDWEGGLSELGARYTSVELQHKASDWR